MSRRLTLRTKKRSSSTGEPSENGGLAENEFDLMTIRSEEFNTVVYEEDRYRNQERRDVILMIQRIWKKKLSPHSLSLLLLL